MNHRKPRLRVPLLSRILNDSRDSNFGSSQSCNLQPGDSRRLSYWTRLPCSRPLTTDAIRGIASAYRFIKQPGPGLVIKMDPPPDHGEKSYKDSGRL